MDETLNTYYSLNQSRYLREQLRLAEARVAELEGALEKYGSHNVSQVLCEASIKEGGKCTCGLEAALAAKGGQ